jgi:hypothetical protein
MLLVGLLPIAILYPIFSPYDVFFLLGLYAIKTVTQLIVLNKATKYLQEKDLLLLSLASELFLLAFYFCLTLSNKLFRKQKWKKI